MSAWQRGTSNPRFLYVTLREIIEQLLGQTTVVG